MPDPTGIEGLDPVLLWGGAVSLAIGLGTGVWRILRVLVRIGKGVDQYLTDWYGEPDRPGMEARPGVLERLQRTEGQVTDMSARLERVTDMSARLERLEHEMHPNSGASLRDAVDRINHQLASMVADGSACSCRSDPPEPSPDEDP